MNTNIANKRVTRISILQSSKMAAALYFAIGLFYTLVGIVMLIAKGSNDSAAMLFILMPVIMGVSGFLFFGLFAAIYNLIANWIGGFEFELTSNE